MGNLCIHDYKSDYYHRYNTTYVKCKKCSVKFIKPNNFHPERRSCNYHIIKNNICITCGTKNFNKKCYHQQKRWWF